MKFYSGLFLDNCEKMHVPLKFGRKTLIFNEEEYILSCLAKFFKKEKYFRQTWRENQTKHCMFNNIFFSKFVPFMM